MKKRGDAIKAEDKKKLQEINKTLSKKTEKMLYEDGLDELDDCMIPKRLFITFHREQAAIFANEVGRNTVRYKCCSIKQRFLGHRLNVIDDEEPDNLNFENFHV